MFPEIDRIESFGSYFAISYLSFDWKSFGFNSTYMVYYREEAHSATSIVM